MTISSVSIILLVIFDQVIKLIVRNYYDVKIPIVENFLYFMPTLNEDYSWINSLLQLGLGKIFHIMLVILILIFVYFGLRYLEYKVNKHLWIDIMKVTLISGGICSLIDKIFWNGSLDYILLKGFFVFDLKDCYITVFEIIAIITMLKNWRVIDDIKGRDILKGYTEFIRNYSKYR